jgi:adenylyltransferase and sulfurtransferase
MSSFSSSNRLTLVPRINPRVEVNAISESLTASNAVAILAPYDIILDCTDNAPTRYLLSDTAVALGKPLVSGAAQKYDGQLCTYNLGNNPCYRCLFPRPSTATASCEETGILGVVAGIIGNMQALETIKILAGLHGR